jgi:hypothetical protein
VYCYTSLDAAQVAALAVEFAQQFGPEDIAQQDYGQFTAMLLTGDYQKYLEQRMPAALKVRPHWATKGLSTVELNQLAESLDMTAEFDCPLYPPPPQSAVLEELPNELTQRLAGLRLAELDGVAARWAESMSQPSYTHSMTGARIMDDCTPQQARRMLWEIASLAKQVGTGQRLYLLTEV